MQTQKEIPAQFLVSPKPVHATVVIGSFGSAQGLIADAFDIDITQDPNKAAPAAPSTVRYGKKPQIHHIFREPTQYPYKVFSIFFMVVIGATLPVLLVVVGSSSFLTLSVSITQLLTLIRNSGSASLARTSARCPKPWAPLPFPMPPSSDLSSRSRSCTSSTTEACLWATS